MAHDSQSTERSSKRDRHLHRPLARVIVDGIDIGQEQIRRGMASLFVRSAREPAPDRRKAYVAAEHEARVERRRLWKALLPIAPWEWRALKRQ